MRPHDQEAKQLRRDRRAPARKFETMEERRQAWSEAQRAWTTDPQVERLIRRFEAAR